MDNYENKASCLIKCREYYIGFPPLFSHYPQDMTEQELKKLNQLASEAMEDPREISPQSGNVRKVVIGTGRHLILGISGYLRHLVKDPENPDNQCQDKTGRFSLGFVGLVWKLHPGITDGIPKSFPALEQFSQILLEQILPHWMDSENSKWATDHTVVDYTYECNGEEWAEAGDYRLNTDPGNICVYPLEAANGLIQSAMQRAAAGEAISLCTDLVPIQSIGCPFLNLTSSVQKTDCRYYKNPWFLPKQQKTSVARQEYEPVSTPPDNRTESQRKQKKNRKNTEKSEKIELPDSNRVILSLKYRDTAVINACIHELLKYIMEGLQRDYPDFTVAILDYGGVIRSTSSLYFLSEWEFGIDLPEGCTLEYFWNLLIVYLRSWGFKGKTTGFSCTVCFRDTRDTLHIGCDYEKKHADKLPRFLSGKKSGDTREPEEYTEEKAGNNEVPDWYSLITEGRTGGSQEDSSERKEKTADLFNLM